MRAANANMNDAINGLAGGAAPGSAAHGVRQLRHSGQGLVNVFGARIASCRCAQQRVQGGTLLRWIEHGAGKEPIDPIGQLLIASQRHQAIEYLSVEALLGQVHQQPGGAEAKSREAIGFFQPVGQRAFHCPRGELGEVFPGRRLRGHTNPWPGGQLLIRRSVIAALDWG